ncbi:MAG TPA: putative PEP-binding protein [Gaiellaceae bacterium]
MSERVLRGLAAAGGVAVAEAVVLRDAEPEESGPGGESERARALGALAAVATELGGAAARLRAAGLLDEAEIIEANRLMAEDPTLESEVSKLALEAPAASAVVRAAEHHAALLADLDDPLLSARAADVRELGRRAARILAGTPPLPAPDRPAILVARDLGPAEISELQLSGGTVCGIALAEGSATSHAAIMARALGLPLVVGLGVAVLSAEDGEIAVLDADRAMLVLGADAQTLREAHAAERRRLAARAQLAARRGRPPVTRDGRRITLLCNASGSAEVRAGLDAGADGVGLLRTELAFLEAAAWPSEQEHSAALGPALAPLVSRIATVRTLDFGADKTPPFLAGIEERGLELMLAHPDALAAQLRAVLRAGAETRLRLLFPLVRDAAQLGAARALLGQALEAVGWTAPRPRVGAMIETPEAAARADEIAAEADFLSIGTNDLVQYTLGLDRELPLASTLAAAAPQVLGHVAAVVASAHALGRAVEVCGEAAGEPPVAALFVGLGVDELSVSPARLDAVRAAVRSLDAAAAAEAARRAVRAVSLEAALELGSELLSVESADEGGEVLDGLGGALA